MVALTGDQKLIFAVVAWIFVVVVILNGFRNATREPPLPHSTRRLRKELERHPSDFEED